MHSSSTISLYRQGWIGVEGGQERTLGIPSAKGEKMPVLHVLLKLSQP